MIISGIIASVKELSDPVNNVYTLISTDQSNPNSYSIRCNMLLEPLDSVQVECEDHENVKIKKCDVKSSGKSDTEEYNGAVSNLLDIFKIKPPRSTGFSEGILDMAAGNLEGFTKAAESILRSVVTGSPISIHFHGDGDGASGAISLYRAINKIYEKLDMSNTNITWGVTRGISYNLNIAYSDEIFFHNYRSADKPLVFVTDFGTTVESNDGIKRIGDVAKQVWIDHHPPEEGFASSDIDLNINPWNTGGDSSLTAGFMTSMVAEMLSGIDTSDMMGASLVSDHSKFAPDDNDTIELAEVLDALNISHGSYDKLTPQYMESVITDREEFMRVLEDYNEQNEEAISIGLNTARKHKSQSGFNIYVMDFGKIARMNMRYIKLGRYTTKLHEAIQEKDPMAVTVVYHKRYISARANRDISKRVGLLKIIKKMLSEREDIENAGGHNEAVSLRVEDDSLDSVVSQFVSYLEADNLS